MNTTKSLTPLQLKALYVATYRQSKGNLFDFTALMLQQNELLNEATIAVIFDMIAASETEKVIVSRGCHNCPFVETRNDYCTVGRDDDQGLNVNHYFINKEFHPECPLLTHTINVVKND